MGDKYSPGKHQCRKEHTSAEREVTLRLFVALLQFLLQVHAGALRSRQVLTHGTTSAGYFGRELITLSMVSPTPRSCKCGGMCMHVSTRAHVSAGGEATYGGGVPAADLEGHRAAALPDNLRGVPRGQAQAAV